MELSFSTVLSAIRAAPSNVRLTQLDAKRVQLSWQFPAEQEQCQLYFSVSGMVDSGSTQQIVKGAARQLLVEVEQPRSVELRVNAANQLGPGPASDFARLGEGPQPAPSLALPQAAAAAGSAASAGEFGRASLPRPASRVHGAVTTTGTSCGD